MPLYAHRVAVLAVALRVPVLLPRLPTHLVNFFLKSNTNPEPSLVYPLGISPSCGRTKPITPELARNKLGIADRERGETGSAVKSIKMRARVIGLWFVLWK
jgi:hypothetical protein